MNSVRNLLARILAPDLLDRNQVENLISEQVAEQVAAARMAMPIVADFDPQGEGYRPVAGPGQAQLRDRSPINQALMTELAYHLYDTSGLVKRFVRDTRNFCLGEGVTWSVAGDDENGSADAWLKAFWTDSMNRMDLRLRDRLEFFFLLGEQCWPAQVLPNGKVWLSYVDPANIAEVHMVSGFPEMAAAVRLTGRGGRTGELLTCVRSELDSRQAACGRLVGNCFFWAINKAPNAPRGRSDLVHLFDFINNFEEGLFDEADRIRQLMAFVWDVELQGASEDDIRKFLKETKAPKSGSMRAHNERVKWNAVNPDLKTYDNRAFYDLMKGYMSACQNRPTSWLGEGGKTYSNEADLMGEPTFKDLGERQRFVKYMLEQVLQFVLDQGVLAGSLREREGERLAVTVNLPEFNLRDLGKVATTLTQLTSALTTAETQGWITRETAAQVFTQVAGQLGMEVEAADQDGDGATKDYTGLDARVRDLVARILAEMKSKGASA